MCEQTTDDIYAYALSKTLTKVSSPATVGLYSSCQNRINMILRQMQAYMKQDDRKSLCGFFVLIWRLLFYRPIWTKENQQHLNTRFIHVHFSAWHFAGSDLLWAGLVIRLFQAMQMKFGKLPLVLYRVTQHDENEEVEKKIVQDGPNHWQSKKILWLFILSIVLVPVVILIVLFSCDLLKPEMKLHEGLNESDGEVGVLEALAIAMLGVPALSALRFAFPVIKNLIFSVDVNIKKEMDNKEISSQLGFMNEVRKEMLFLSHFIQFMEVFEKRRIRVVLQITNLDRCSPQKIVAVLEAINILLSDEESPFISILAVNPDVLVQKVNFADGCFSREDRAYALLNRIVTLTFTVPPLCDDSKRRLFNSLASKSEERIVNSENPSSSDVLSVVEVAEDNAFEMKEADPLINKTTVTLDVNEKEVDMLVRSILISNGKKLNKYMSDDTMSIRRVISSIRVIVIILKSLKKEPPHPEYIAAWVVLATQWPCRLSWILQCVEDAQQRADIDGKDVANADDSKTLWKVFSESRTELYMMHTQIEDLLEQDGDPEMFEKFLTVDFQFTVKDLMSLEVATVNLDHSIRKQLAQIRATSRLKDFGWRRNLAPLPITTIINMNTEDVCNELKRMEYPSKYIDIVQSNDLNGSSLVFGNVDDIQRILDMTFGEWTAFSLHFMGSRSHLQQQYRNVPWMRSQSKPQKIPLQVAHYYSSNPNLINSSM